MDDMVEQIKALRVRSGPATADEVLELLERLAVSLEHSLATVADDFNLLINRVKKLEGLIAK